MNRRIWKAMGIVLAVLLVGSIAVMAEQGTDDLVNTLRVYGKDGYNAAFPYDSYQGPFDLTSPEAPPKDFVQWNPAYLWHFDTASNEVYGRFFGRITASDRDANQKVHLRHWYVPEYAEPAGLTWVDQPSRYSDAIVLEYTYILLDVNTNDPTSGLPGTTRFAFPIGDQSHQLGLDDWDVFVREPGEDPEGFVTHVETLARVGGIEFGDFPPPSARVDSDFDGVPTTWVDLSTGPILVEPGDEIVFLDHRFEVKNIVPTWAPGTPGIEVDIFYNGEIDHLTPSRNVLREGVIIPWQSTLSAGRHRVSVEALTDSPPNPPSRSAEFIDGDSRLSLVTEPWYLQVRGVGNRAEIVVGRLMTQGESFFVGGVEYSLPKVFAPEPEAVAGPVPQVEEYLGTITSPDYITATYQVNVPNWDGSYFSDACDVTVHGGEMVGEPDPVTGEIVVKSCCNVPIYVDYCYDSREFKYITVRNSLPKESSVYLERLSVLKQPVYPLDHLPFLPPFNMTHDIIDDVNIDRPDVDLYPDWQYPDGDIFERRVEDQAAVEAYYMFQDKEGRFDTSLLEEKFTHPGGTWEWIHIETHPWHYTEFVLPEIDGLTDGDYILVSSFITQDSTQVWCAEEYRDAVRVKFYYDAAVGPVNSADVYVNDAFFNVNIRTQDPGFEWPPGVEPANSLRVYGRDDEDAAFPYTDFAGPFDLTHPEAPPKDFIVFNPAYHGHVDWSPAHEAEWDWGAIVVSGQDANQKVHLRQWYVPDYTQPVGDVWLELGLNDYETQAEIVKEYTYILLDMDNNPLLGTPGSTEFWFPVASRLEFDPTDAATQVNIGIDCYDWDVTDLTVPAEPKLVHLEDADTVVGGRFHGDPFVKLSTGTIRVEEGDWIEFLDHSIYIEQVVSQVPGPRVIGKVYYTGNNAHPGQPLPGLLTVEEGEDGSAGRHNIRHDGPEVVTWPWFIEVEGVLSEPVNAANVRIGRLLKEGEAFYVDGAEYGVARLGGVAAHGELLYITLRNGLPKDDEVVLDRLSIWKNPVVEFENLPLLPPFRMDHTMVDDIDGAGTTGEPDEQGPDNVDGITGNIADRLATRDAILEYYIDQAKEIRFDTALGEEKFFEPAQEWMWINIETQPWNYTEFVLPTGDLYLLVSSWLTEDSDAVWTDWTEWTFPFAEGLKLNGLNRDVNKDAFDRAVRMKFVHHPFDGTGIYVNLRSIEPEPVCIDPTITALTADPEVAELGEVITFQAEVGGTPPLTFEWDFGDEGAGELVGGGEEFGEYIFAEIGTYTVTLTLTNVCSDVVAEDTVVVEVVEPVEPEEFQIFLPIVTKDFAP